MSEAVGGIAIATEATRADFLEYAHQPSTETARTLKQTLRSNLVRLDQTATTTEYGHLINASIKRLQDLTVSATAQAELLSQLQESLGSHSERQQWYGQACIGSGSGLSAISELACSGERLELLARRKAQSQSSSEAIELHASVMKLRSKELGYAMRPATETASAFKGVADQVRQMILRQQPAAKETASAFEDYLEKYASWSQLVIRNTDEMTRMSGLCEAMLQPLAEAQARVREFQTESIQSLADLRRLTDRTMLAVSLAAALCSGLISYLVANSVTRPLAALRQAMNKLATGETSLLVPHVRDKDEIGEMARAVEVFRDTAIERQQLVATQLTEAEQRAGRGQEIEQQIRTFDHGIGETLIALRKAAEKLDSAAIGLKTASSEVDRRCSEAGGAATSTAQRVTVVASAADQLVNSIREISEQTSRSSGVAERADKQAEETMTHMSALVQSVEKISEFTGLIGAIASQTNLLALNATIEAARAGDAGRGFAVVASEVKNLAAQTANATDEISRLIGIVHHSSTESMKAVGSVSTIISDMRHISVALASAMHEQDAGIAEIASSMNVLSEEARIGATAVGSAEQAARSAASIAQQVGELASLLGDATVDIDGNVSDFLATVRAA